MLHKFVQRELAVWALSKIRFLTGRVLMSFSSLFLLNFMTKHLNLDLPKFFLFLDWISVFYEPFLLCQIKYSKTLHFDFQRIGSSKKAFFLGCLSLVSFEGEIVSPWVWSWASVKNESEILKISTLVYSVCEGLN